MDHRQIVRTLAVGRVAVGATLTLFPAFGGGRWIGSVAGDPAVKVITRAFGVRDLALGLGTLQALNGGGSAKSWVGLSAVADAVDAAATVLGLRAIGPAKALPVLAVAAASAAAHSIAYEHLD